MICVRCAASYTYIFAQRKNIAEEVLHTLTIFKFNFKTNRISLFLSCRRYSSLAILLLLSACWQWTTHQIQFYGFASRSLPRPNVPRFGRSDREILNWLVLLTKIIFAVDNTIYILSVIHDCVATNEKQQHQRKIQFQLNCEFFSVCVCVFEVKNWNWICVRNFCMLLHCSLVRCDVSFCFWSNFVCGFTLVWAAHTFRCLWFSIKIR